MTDIPFSHRYKLCESKRSYKNEKEALKALKSIRKKRLVPENGGAYKCPIDPTHWHLGHRRLNEP